MYTLSGNNNSNSSQLRIAFPYAKSAMSYEPSRIHLAPEYIFLENVLSPLVEMDPKTGQVQDGVAESYYWNGNELHLVIRSNLKTVNGTPITSKDAEFSLKRLLTMPGNTHGDFKELICGSGSFESVEQSCSGIRSTDHELILTTTDAGKTFLLPMLTAIDFAVVRRGSVDPKTLQIIDWENTSGPYYVAKDSPDGKIELRANPNHYHYSMKMAQVIQLVPTNPKAPKGSLEDFAANKVDFITTVDAARADDVIAFSRGRSDLSLHTTMNLRSFILVFTERGQKELSSEQRFAIGQGIRKEIWSALAGNNGFESSRELFPPFGEGAIDPSKIDSIQNLYSNAKAAIPANLKLVFVRLGDASKFIGATKKAFPNFEIGEAEKNPNFIKYDSIEQQPHMILSGPDTGFLEDIGLISYSTNAGYFAIPKDKRKDWLQTYMAEPSKPARLEKLKKLHEESLMAPVVVPLLIAPYAAVVRSPWKMNLSQLYANVQLWLIQTP